MKTCFVFAVLCLLASWRADLAAAEGQAVMRTWTDASGAFTVQAKLLGVDDGKVRLEKADGTAATVPLQNLSEADRAYVSRQAGAKAAQADEESEAASKGESRELAHDDGTMAGKRSMAGTGHAVRFEVDGDSWYVTSVKLHGSRYGYPQAPREDFHVWICDEKLKRIAELKFPYSTFTRGEPKWVTMRVKPTKVPPKFAVCVGFNPEQTKGVYVSFDAEGTGNSLIGLPGAAPKPFSGGDWLIRAKVEQRKGGAQREGGKSGSVVE